MPITNIPAISALLNKPSAQTKSDVKNVNFRSPINFVRYKPNQEFMHACTVHRIQAPEHENKSKDASKTKKTHLVSPSPTLAILHLSCPLKSQKYYGISRRIRIRLKTDTHFKEVWVTLKKILSTHTYTPIFETQNFRQFSPILPSVFRASPWPPRAIITQTL